MKGTKMFLNKKKTKGANMFCEQYRNLSEEEREKMSQYSHKRYKDLLADEKRKLMEYIKN